MSEILDQEVAKAPPEYEVRITSSSGYLHVHLSYLPSRKVWATGEFAVKLFSGLWKYRRATRWIRASIRHHQHMISCLEHEVEIR